MTSSMTSVWKDCKDCQSRLSFIKLFTFFKKLYNFVTPIVLLRPDPVRGRQIWLRSLTPETCSIVLLLVNSDQVGPNLFKITDCHWVFRSFRILFDRNVQNDDSWLPGILSIEIDFSKNEIIEQKMFYKLPTVEHVGIHAKGADPLLDPLSKVISRNRPAKSS